MFDPNEGGLREGGGSEPRVLEPHGEDNRRGGNNIAHTPIDPFGVGGFHPWARWDEVLEFRKSSVSSRCALSGP